MKGIIIGLDFLIGLILFTAVFATFLVKMSIANSTVLNQETSIAAEISIEAQVQHLISALETVNANLSTVRETLQASFGKNYLLSSLAQNPNVFQNPFAVKRLLIINGDLYYLLVYNNETTN